MADQTEMMDQLLKSNSEQPVQEKTDILMEILKLLRERTGAALVPEEVSPIVRERTGAAPSELEIQSILDLLRTKMESDRKKPDEYYDFMRGLIYDDKGLRYEKPEPNYMDDIVSKAKGD